MFYTGSMAEKLFELARRRFDTPKFRGMEFIEVESKSILNHVPGDRFGFNWTINPYRGCQHACHFCLDGETPVLMSDGRTRAIKDLVVGDEIYGTRMEGHYRRYVKTEVLAHWQTVKPAYRVLLDDGTEIVSSGDHRFMSNRGWKYVTGTERGPEQRPHLTEGDHLLGPGRFVECPKTDAEALFPDTQRWSVKEIESLGVEIPMYDITTGTGNFIANGVISHNCFARPTHEYLDMNAGKDFETKIIVKVNAPQLLRKELRAKRWKGELVALGTNTDPYQRAEGRYRLTRQILEVLTEYRNQFSILTKGTLILRDIDVLRAATAVTDVSTAFSIPTVDEKVWKLSEPGTPHPRKRLEAVARLNEAGIPCGVMIAAVQPGISDHPDQLEAVTRGAVEAGATFVTPILLHIRPGLKEHYMGWLADTYPHLVPKYQEMYPKSYASVAARKELSGFVASVARDAGMKPRPRKPRKVPVPLPRHQQMKLI